MARKRRTLILVCVAAFTLLRDVAPLGCSRSSCRFLF
jgi:hypothetical protein